jgi:protein-S-isoprenylcysteine O-methyltransferase Ste14
MSGTEPALGVGVARAYFAVQAAAGAVWWIAVFASPDLERWTLGEWQPTALLGPDLALFVGASAIAAVWANRVAALVAALWTTGLTVALGTYGLVTQMAGWGVVLMAVATAGTLGAAATLWFGSLPTDVFFAGPFSFRVAHDKARWRHLTRSLIQLVVFWTTFFVIIPLALAAVEQRLGLSWPALDQHWVRLVGVALFLMGSVVGLWSCVTMALRGHGTPLPAHTARDLVVSGPYRWIRNPMATAGASQTVGVGLIVGSWTVIAIALTGAVAWNALIRPTEEADLQNRFGDSYRQYTAGVRCWLPTLREPQTSSHTTTSERSRSTP